MNAHPKQQPVTESGEKLPDPPPEIGEGAEVPEDEDEQESLEQVRRRYLLGRFWLSAKGFWGRHGSAWAWPLSFGLLGLIVLNVGVQYGINVWNRYIFDALEKKDAATVFSLIAIFIPLAAGSVTLGVIMVYVRMSMQRRWRAWLNHAVIDRWLANGRYYQLNLVSGDHKNPEFRIADDLRISTDAPVDFFAGVTSAFLSATTFIVVLWTIGGALTLHIGGSEITIPGFLVIAAVIYAAIACDVDALDRQELRRRLRGQEPGGSRVSLRADAHPRERREHRAARRRGGGARGHRPLVRPGACANGRASAASTCARPSSPTAPASLRR